MLAFIIQTKRSQGMIKRQLTVKTGSLEVSLVKFKECRKKQRVVARYPHETDKFHFHEAKRIVLPAINFDSSQNLPAHNTGGAVDI